MSNTKKIEGGGKTKVKIFPQVGKWTTGGSINQTLNAASKNIPAKIMVMNDQSFRWKSDAPGTVRYLSEDYNAAMKRGTEFVTGMARKKWKGPDLSTKTKGKYGLDYN